MRGLIRFAMGPLHHNGENPSTLINKMKKNGINLTSELKSGRAGRPGLLYLLLDGSRYQKS